MGILLLCACMSTCTHQEINSRGIIVFSRVPPADAGGTDRLATIEGRVIGEHLGQHIVLFAKAGLWYVQPLANQPFTNIAPDSSWKNSTHLGSEYAALVVDSSYHPPATIDALPAEGQGILSVAWVRGAPPFWQTWWFRLTCIFTVALAAWILYRMRMHQKIARLNVRFEERLAERTRIAQELHDTLLQGVFSATMQLGVVADTLPDGSTARRDLAHVLELMHQITDDGRNTLQGLRSSRRNSDRLEHAFARIPQEIIYERDIACRVIVEGLPRPLHPVIRDEVYRIGREALVNAFRHSKSANIELQVEYAAAHLRVTVQDDGCGIDTAVLQSGREGHWGLTGMRERAESVGAKLRLWSRVNAGTEVELIVPCNVAYQPALGSGRPGWIAKLHIQTKANYSVRTTNSTLS